MKKIFAVLLLFFAFGFTNSVLASQIPNSELTYLKTRFNDLNVRFDGLVELSDGTAYIPVYPAELKNVDVISITQTIPAKLKLKDKPDFIMFNSNFALFKLIKDNDKSTIIYNENIPENVKLGLLPQDLLVPTGFQIPGELRIIAGDLVIPFAPLKEYKEINISKKSGDTAKVAMISPEQLSDKNFYATSFNSNTVSVLNADTGKAFKKR